MMLVLGTLFLVGVVIFNIVGIVVIIKAVIKAAKASGENK